MKKNYVFVGRPNVGKSSLFNFFIGKHEAFVKDEDGTTIDWRSKNVGNVVFWDTPGVFKISDLPPVEIDKIIFVIEPNVLNYDKQLYLELKKKFDVVVIVNKVDLVGSNSSFNTFDDYSFFGDPVFVSLKNRIGFNDLKRIVDTNSHEVENIKKIWAIMGKPNVGKSSITNLLAKKELHKVEDYEGTTKECLPVELDDEVLVDTPGQRRKALFPKYSNIFGIVFVIDLKVQRQDLKTLGLMFERRKPMFVVINKIDIAKGNEIKEIEEKITKFWDVPILKISCANKKNIEKIEDMMKQQEANYEKRIKTSQLNAWLREEIMLIEPRLKFMTQIETMPPKFFLDTKLDDHKERMLKRRLSKKFEFSGIPILFQYKKSAEKSDQ